MSLEIPCDIDFKEDGDHIRVLSNGEHFFAAWLKDENVHLVVNYDITQNKFDKFEGKLSEYINKPEFSTEEKIDRVFEALNNGLWNYFNPSMSVGKKVKP